MAEQSKDFKNVRDSIQELLDYFSRSYDSITETITSLKTELFEINVRLDELYQTKSLYTLSNNSRKNVFTPIQLDSTETSKEAAIMDQISDLSLIKDTLETKILEQEIDFKEIKRKVKMLKSSLISLDSIETDMSDLENELSDLNKDSIEIVRDDSTPTVSHGTNVLMLDAFDKTFVSTLLDKRVKDELSSNCRKLDTLRFMISTNPEQAKVMAGDISGNLMSINYTIDTILKQNNYFIDTDKPVYYLLDNLILDIRDHHQDTVIEANINSSNKDRSISYVKSITLINLMNIFFDNIFKHANAKLINVDIDINEKDINVKIKDNGIGIPHDYNSFSPWYSGLHKAHELIYLLDGSLSVGKAPDKGTLIEFSFSTL